IDLQRGLLEAAELALQSRNRRGDLVGRADPGAARGDLLGGIRGAQRGDHLVVAGVILRNPAIEPVRGSLDQRSQISVDQGRGSCVGRGNEVVFSIAWKRPRWVTFSRLSSRSTCSTPSRNRATDSSGERPKRRNSCGRNARANPTSSRPRDSASSIAISPASFSGWLKAGSTAPVTSRACRVRCAAAARKTIGLGL